MDRQQIAHIRLLHAGADKMLNELVEAEMFHLMRKHPSMSVLLKCMGALTGYDVNGESQEYAFLRPLNKLLDELDRTYYCRTARALKITRGAADPTALYRVRDW